MMVGSCCHATIFALQSFARGKFGREQFLSLRANSKAVIIQRHVRGWLARVRYRKVRRGFIMLQAHVRRHAAKKELKKLKVILYSFLFWGKVQRYSRIKFSKINSEHLLCRFRSSISLLIIDVKWFFVHHSFNVVSFQKQCLCSAHVYFLLLFHERWLIAMCAMA